LNYHLNKIDLNMVVQSGRIDGELIPEGSLVEAVRYTFAGPVHPEEA
jgi:hypothetical protein